MEYGRPFRMVFCYYGIFRSITIDCKFNIEKFLMGMNIFSLYRNLSGSG